MKLSQAQIRKNLNPPFECPNCNMGVFLKPSPYCLRCKLNVKLGRGLEYFVTQDQGKGFIEI